MKLPAGASQSIGIAALLVALAVWSTLGVWTEVFRTGWEVQEQSHILLALPVAIWLAWLRRGRLRLSRLKPSIIGPIAIAAGWAIAWWGFSNGFDLARHFGSLLMVVGSILSVVGLDVMRQFLPSVIALVFLFPVPGRIRLPIALQLQETTASITFFLMELIGIPVELAGNVLSLNGQQVQVAEACNGMRMVSALALVAFAFVFSVPMRQGVRVFILLISPIVALAVNIIRLFPTVLFYGYADESLATLFHDLSGWLGLILALCILWLALTLLRWIEIPVAPYELRSE